jgi:hypothetical protein
VPGVSGMADACKKHWRARKRNSKIEQNTIAVNGSQAKYSGHRRTNAPAPVLPHTWLRVGEEGVLWKGNVPGACV